MHKRNYCIKFTYIENFVVISWVAVGVTTSLNVAAPMCYWKGYLLSCKLNYNSSILL